VSLGFTTTSMESQMRNRRKTIESLERLADRPGTKSEGEVARKMLERMRGSTKAPKPFNNADFPRGSIVWYNYWCYRNERGVIVGRDPKTIQGEAWVRIKFDRSKNACRVPVTSRFGCHLSLTPLGSEESEYLYMMQD
jgi:hypothetical protein